MFPSRPGRRSDTKILFVCIENAGRSQMAEAFAKRLGLTASSAGTVPAKRVNATVVRVMKEKGLDISGSIPKLLTVEMIGEADLVVTMGCSVEQVCPRPLVDRMRKKLMDWQLDDPKDKPIEQVRMIRDEIERRVTKLSKGSPLSGPNPKGGQE
jgi:arsenate reductase